MEFITRCKKKLISTKSNEKYKSPDLDSSIRNGN